MANGPYTLQQQTAVLSILSNYASNHMGTETELRERLSRDVAAALRNPAYTSHIGQWSVVWGPAVAKEALSLQADNAMMAVRNEATGDLVVAMAGTNPGSLFDATIEDLGVGKTVPFDGPTGAWVSAGTAAGVRILQTMTDPATGRTMLDFLEALPPTTANLIFTGHSLGGALAPALALDYAVHHGLNANQTFRNVYVYPSAGPSPGNAAFAALFAQTFPATGSTPLDAWNQNVRNTIDMIPCAWTALPTLPSLYPALNHGKPIPCIQSLVNAVMPEMKGNVYADIPTIFFPGTFDAGVHGPIPGATAAWMAQSVHQHIDAYENELVPELASELPVLLKLPATTCVALTAWCLVSEELGG